LKLSYFVWNVLKKTLNLYGLKPNIFFILSSFWEIKKAMGVATNDLQDFFEIQM